MKTEVDNTNVDQENVSTTTENKEKICKFFNSKKGCVKGENCDFLHIKIEKKNDSKKASEKQRTNNNDNENNDEESKKSKRNNKKGKKENNNDKKICKFFNTPEGCKKGDKCQFLHIKNEDNESLDGQKKSKKENNNNNNNKSGKNSNKNNRNIKNDRNNKKDNETSSDEKQKQPQEDESKKEVKISYPKNFNPARRPVARPQPRIPENKTPRDIEMDQLERRYRETYKVVENIPAYTKVAFDFSPTDPDFPFELDSMRIELLIPMTYPIGACKMTNIIHEDIPPHLITNIINTFNRKANMTPRVSLIELMNWLDRCLEYLLVNRPEEPSVIISFVSNTKKPEDKEKEKEKKKEKDNGKDGDDGENEKDGEEEDDDDDDDDDSEDHSVDLNDIDFDNQISDDEDEDDEDLDALYSENKDNAKLTHGYEEEDDENVDIEEADENENAILPTSISSEIPKGIHIRLPNIKILNISLLQCTGLSLTLKCDRCRNIIDFNDVRPKGQLKLKSTSNNKKEEGNKEEDKPFIVNSVYWKHCKTCRQAIGIRYRSEYLTPASLAIGYIDLEGCVPFDFLPSNFIIQCENCNTDQPALNGVKRAQDNDVFCRKCNTHMVLNIDLIKYVKFAQTEKLDDEGLPSATRVKLKKKKEKEQSLGIIQGQPLPNRGICEHYKKSYRWFRFPCCGKIFPCDVCHDLHSDHESKWANRMICGFCSKEQPFSDKDCSCGKSLTKKAVSHWEGGKGNRDTSTMNKRDKQKYSGMNKTISKKAQRKIDSKKSKKNKK